MYRRSSTAHCPRVVWQLNGIIPTIHCPAQCGSRLQDPLPTAHYMPTTVWQSMEGSPLPTAQCGVAVYCRFSATQELASKPPEETA